MLQTTEETELTMPSDFRWHSFLVSAGYLPDTEYSLYENGNGRKCFDLNWGGYPQKEYDELKRIAIEINKNQGKYDKLNCIEFLKS